MKKMKRPLLAGLCGLLAAALMGCSSSYESVEKAVRSALQDGNPRQAVQIGRDWLDDHQQEEDWEERLQQADLYRLLYDIYREELDNPGAAEELLRQGCKVTGDDGLLDMYLETITQGEGLKELGAAFPTAQEILLDGRPFKDWTPQELWDFLPPSEEGYQDWAEDSWNRSEYYKNGYITASYYLGYEDRGILNISFMDFDTYSNTYAAEGPQPQLPRGLAAGDSIETALKKMGVPQELIDYFADSCYLGFTVQEDGVQVSMDPYESGSKYVEISYDNREYYGTIGFQFQEEKGLSSYEISHWMT